jgi:hypothetical protein
MVVMPQQVLDYAARPSRVNTIAGRVSRRLRRVFPYLPVTLICYVGSYALLSAFGEYQPAVIGTNGVKWYAWCPAGLHSGYRQRWAINYFYAPLYVADKNYWHRFGDEYSGKYPTRTPSTPAEWKEWRGK